MLHQYYSEHSTARWQQCDGSYVAESHQIYATKHFVSEPRSPSFQMNLVCILQDTDKAQLWSSSQALNGTADAHNITQGSPSSLEKVRKEKSYSSVDERNRGHNSIFQ